MKNVLLIGSSGRMGREIWSLLDQNSSLRVAGGLALNPQRPTEVKTLEEIDSETIDVVIDFSSPKLFSEVFKWCSENNVAIVCGTTGLKSEQLNLLRTSQSVPVFYSANMSIGVAVLRKALKGFSALKDFDFQIVEAHHNQKKDSPSGTALLLQDALTEAIGKNAPEPLAIRGGGIFGIHSIHAMGEEETLEFTHTALNRAVFARGAIMAAEFLVQQRPGFYSMDDLLDSK